jgi:hypothetical protein
MRDEIDVKYISFDETSTWRFEVVAGRGGRKGKGADVELVRHDRLGDDVVAQ